MSVGQPTVRQTMRAKDAVTLAQIFIRSRPLRIQWPESPDRTWLVKKFPYLEGALEFLENPNAHTQKLSTRPRLSNQTPAPTTNAKKNPKKVRKLQVGKLLRMVLDMMVPM
ncbi:hypothetical protein O181_125817 [Austropuccinia psidii MF-1]|uniref:Uncharacterized protein n=1 Tax=Austropuccinia psidii MF-1 TaxID=1389203 RepID=A0A9Q3Q7V7_9BASI|nr:hypothetical protein [Austropuccinia psidii MF-1]